MLNGQKIREMREQLRLSRAALSRESGVSERLIEDIEGNRYRHDIGIRKALGLAGVLGVAVEDLLA